MSELGRLISRYSVVIVFHYFQLSFPDAVRESPNFDEWKICGPQIFHSSKFAPLIQWAVYSLLQPNRNDQLADEVFLDDIVCYRKVQKYC